ncbi:MAG: hypothetical protein J6V50_03620 [Clostridia bacterium]|nr:hypothetical protein [Clostridia bacterium]
MEFKKNIFKCKSAYFDLSAPSKNTADIADWENMMFCKEGVKTRPGIEPLRGDALFDLYPFSEFARFRLTDFFMVIDGKTAQLAVAIEGDSVSYIYYQILAIFSDGTRRDLGFLPFNRTASTDFEQPYSYVLYAGKKTIGGGIYFLARFGTGKDTDNYRIYEITEDLNDWKLLSSNDFYTPTVLCHGRGNRVNLALTMSDITLSKPKMLEAKNLLSGSFKCYYTTDNFSNGFALPNFEGAPSEIHITLRTDTDSVFNWILNADNYFSASVTVKGSPMTAKYLPEHSEIFFYDSANYAFPPDYYGLENNLCFSVKGTTDERLRVASMTKATNILGFNKKGSASVTVFSGSFHNAKEALWINPENPLYFPSCCACTLSNFEGDEENVQVVNNNVIFLKDKSATSFKVTAAEGYSIENIINGVENADEVSYPALISERRISLPEKINTNSVTRCGNEIWLCGEGGSIYCLNSSLSLKSYPAALKIKPVCASVSGQQYFAFDENECSVFDFSEEGNGSVYNWKFPVKITASTDFGNETLFFAKDQNDSVYVYRLGGDFDRYFIDRNKVKNEEISAYLSLLIEHSGEKKRLYSFISNARLQKAALLEIFDDDKKIGHHIISNGKSVLNRPSFFENLKIKISFQGLSTLLGVGIRYSKLSKNRR